MLWLKKKFNILIQTKIRKNLIWNLLFAIGSNGLPNRVKLWKLILTNYIDLAKYLDHFWGFQYVQMKPTIQFYQIQKFDFS